MSRPITTTPDPGVCAGASARGRCAAPARFQVLRRKGEDTYSMWETCGRHLGWLIDQVTESGHAVTVNRRVA